MGFADVWSFVSPLDVTVQRPRSVLVLVVPLGGGFVCPNFVSCLVLVLVLRVWCCFRSSVLCAGFGHSECAAVSFHVFLGSAARVCSASRDLVQKWEAPSQDSLS